MPPATNTTLRRRASLVSPLPTSPNLTMPRSQSATGLYTKNGITPSESMSNIGDDNKGQVKVVVRIRPSDPDDANVPPKYRNTLVHPNSTAEVRVDFDPSTLAGNGASSSKRHPTFSFDRVLAEDASQVDLYEATAKDSIEEFLKGFNVTFLAYGQTSSGKSYSMGTTGEDTDYANLESNPRAGLIPRTVETIFRRAEEIRASSGPSASWECRVSFLELYNEEIIDLLSGSQVTVSIRETQDGRIVWCGVREVKARSVAEVMTLLHDGSARRRTGSTNMNSTSSRSHAIFSLTLTQTRRSESPSVSEFGVSRLKRPSSAVGLSNPRSPTPTSKVPPSSFGHKTSLPRPNSMHLGALERDPGDMVVVTAKFNMVDLAGSERLKRTAAQGERMKEGISINSGLLALGNVISALAEPARNRGHIPYRDSKLTRMLQDSIGGNSLTTMIACVSPIEYNVSETLNTINYASRARKIRNTLSKNQVEVGWDDIEYLRTTVVKLRAKLASETGVKGEGEGTQTQVELLNDRLSELQREFTELQNQYFVKCHELVALNDANTGEDEKIRVFNETIEPVILEYEKVVNSLNAQLAELRSEADLAVTMNTESQQALFATKERLTQNEGYVEELRGRVAKLTERNEASEAHIRAMESNLRTHADAEVEHSEVVAQLSTEIQQLKEQSSQYNKYISQLESRLASSDSRNSELLAAVEKYESESVKRDDAYRSLERKISALDLNQQDAKLMAEELEQRDRKISDLQDLLAAQSRERPIPEPQTPHNEFETPPETPPQTPVIFRSIAEDTDEVLSQLRKENAELAERLRVTQEELSAAQAIPTSPSSKRKSSGEESSESGSTPQTPKHRSRAPSPEVLEEENFHDSLPALVSPTDIPSYATTRRGFRHSLGPPNSRLLRPLSLSQGLSSLAASDGSPRSSWSAPIGMLYEQQRPTKRQSIPFDLKPQRSMQSLEIDNALLQKTVTDREAQLKQRESEIKYLKKTLEGQTLAIPSPSIAVEEAMTRIRDEHAVDMKQLKSAHNEELESLKSQHEVDLGQLRQVHEAAIATAHEGAQEEKKQILAAVDARHLSEIDALESKHHAAVAELEKKHDDDLAALQAELTTLSESLKAVQDQLAQTTAAKTTVEQELASRPDPSTVVSLEDHNIVIAAMEQMEKTMADAEDERRQFKLRADQARFELSRIRDEHQVQRSSDLKQIAELDTRLSVLLTAKSKEIDELQSPTSASGNRDSKQSAEGRDRASRTKLPPIGPPPSAPLPPLPPVVGVLSPAGSNANLPSRESTHSVETDKVGSGSQLDLSGSSRSDGGRPRSMSAGKVEQIALERDHAIAERDEAIHEATEAKEKVSQVEQQLQDEKRQNETTTRDIVELRKNNSKLKVRIDDVTREMSDIKRDRDGLKREIVEVRDELSREKTIHESDLAKLDQARSEAVRHKAKFDQLVDAKVNNKTSQKFKCF